MLCQIKLFILLTLIQCYFLLAECRKAKPEPVPVILNLKTENSRASCEVKPPNITVLVDGAVRIFVRVEYYINRASYRVGAVEKEIEKVKNETVIEVVQGGTYNFTYLFLKGIAEDDLPYPVIVVDESTYRYASCIFPVHVKRTDVLSVLINRDPWTTTLSDLSTDYDAEVRYEFFDGELADITCGKRDELRGQIQLTYKHYLVYTMTKHGTANIQVKLRAVDNNTYVLCKYEPFADEDWALVKILLVLQPPKDPHDDADAELSIRVNGLKRKSTTLKNLRCYGNELIKIDCERNDDSIGTLSWDYDKSNRRFVMENTEIRAVDTTKNISITFSPSSSRYIHVNCIYKPDKTLSQKNISQESVDITPDKKESFYITGLQEDNKLVVYDQSKGSNTRTNLEYEYVGTERLNLTCKQNVHNPNIPKVGTVEWKSDSEQFTSPNNKISVLLDDRNNNTELLCIAKDEPPTYNPKGSFILKEIHIKMIQRVRSVVKTTPSPDTTPTVSSISNPAVDGQVTLGDDGMNPLLIAAVIAGGCIILVIICITVVVRGKHNKDQIKRDSNINYENLPPSNSNTMPTPVQWNENHYAQPVDNRGNDDTYSVPYKPTIEELYSKPLTKTKRKNIPDATYAEVGCSNNYAQVVPKSQRNQPPNDHYAELDLKVREKDHGYVNAIAQESPYAEIGEYRDAKYGNVFPNSPYVNTGDTSEYAETAYCEVSKIYNK